MKLLRILIVFAGIAIPGGAGFAQNLDDTALARCPGYERDNPSISQVEWSVKCLLTAIYNGDREIVAALSPSSRCRPEPEPEHCDGPLDRHTSEDLFGIGASGRRDNGREAVSVWLRKAKNYLVAFHNPFQGQLEVRIIPRPGKSEVDVREGLYKDYYATDFILDPDRAVWTVYGMIFYFETDSYQNAMDGTPVDLTGWHSARPPFMWEVPTQR